MESRRCKTLVEREMDKLGLKKITVELGEIEFDGDISDEKLQLFDSALKNLGLEVLVDRKSRLVAKIKDAVYQLVYLTDDLPKPNYSDYISEKVNVGYSTLSNIFQLRRTIPLKSILLYNELNV